MKPRALPGGKAPTKKKPRHYDGGKFLETLQIPGGAPGLFFEADLYLRHVTAGFGIIRELAAWCEEFQVEATGTDLVQVRKAIEAKIQEKASFTWEPWLVIDVKEFCDEKGDVSAWNEHGFASELEITVSAYFFAERGGKKFHRSQHDGEKARIDDGWPKAQARHSSCTSSGMRQGHWYTTRAVLRDTPEARAGLDVIRNGLHRLNLQLSALLAQKNITTTLENLLQGRDDTGRALPALLPPPAKDPNP